MFIEQGFKSLRKGGAASSLLCITHVFDMFSLLTGLRGQGVFGATPWWSSMRAMAGRRSSSGGRISGRKRQRSEGKGYAERSFISPNSQILIVVLLARDKFALLQEKHVQMSSGSPLFREKPIKPRFSRAVRRPVSGVSERSWPPAPLALDPDSRRGPSSSGSWSWRYGKLGWGVGVGVWGRGVCGKFFFFARAPCCYLADPLVHPRKVSLRRRTRLRYLSRRLRFKIWNNMSVNRDGSTIEQPPPPGQRVHQ